MKPDDNRLKWTNFLKDPTIPKVVPVKAPPWVPPGWVCLLASGIWGLMAGVLGFRGPGIRWHKLIGPTGTAALAAVGLVATRPVAPTQERVMPLMNSLLRNVYVAFDFREESAIYDALEHSISGDLLTQVYLETKKSLELASQGGAWVNVKDVELISVDPSERSAAPFAFVASAWSSRSSS